MEVFDIANDAAPPALDATDAARGCCKCSTRCRAISKMVILIVRFVEIVFSLVTDGLALYEFFNAVIAAIGQLSTEEVLRVSFIVWLCGDIMGLILCCSELG